MWDLKLPSLPLAFWPACEQEQTGGRRWVLNPVILIQIHDCLGKGGRDHFQTGRYRGSFGETFLLHPSCLPNPSSTTFCIIVGFYLFQPVNVLLLFILKSVCFSLKHRLKSVYLEEVPCNWNCGHKGLLLWGFRGPLNSETQNIQQTAPRTHTPKYLCLEPQVQRALASSALLSLSS